MLRQYRIVTLIDADETTLCMPLAPTLPVPDPIVFNLGQLQFVNSREGGERDRGGSEID